MGTTLAVSPLCLLMGNQVFVGEKNVNKELLFTGLAWHYKKYSQDPELVKLEIEARFS